MKVIAKYTNPVPHDEPASGRVSAAFRQRCPVRQCLLAVSITALFGGVCSTAASRDKLANGQFNAEWKSGNNSIRVKIEAATFVPAEHQIRIVNGEKYVDGQRAIGIDGTGPIYTEIRTFNVSWNDKPVRIPKTAYATVFNFSLRKASLFPGESGELVGIKSSRNDALLFIFASGATSVREWVWLVISRDGKWFRFEGSDGASPLGN